MTMRVRNVLAILAASTVLVLAGCGGDEPAPATTPTPSSSSTPSASPPGGTVTIPGTPTAVPSMELAGQWYPIPVAQCMQKVWDDRVAEWNRLPERSDANGVPVRVVNGRTYETPEEYHNAKGWPLTFDATMRAPATYRGCRNAR